MHRFSLGSAAITVFNTGDLRADLAAWLGKRADDWPQYRHWLAAPMAVPMNCVHIALGDASVLVDACDATCFIGTEFHLPDAPPQLPLPDQMRAAGITPESVTHVVITHTHSDHFSGLLNSPPASGEEQRVGFPNAWHYVGHEDFIRENPSSLLGTAGLLQSRNQLICVEHDLSIAPDIDILAAPGETPGHQVVRVRSQGQTLYIIGDLYHHEVEFAQPDWNVTWADAPTNNNSRAMFTTAARAEDAYVVAGHIRRVGQFDPSTKDVVWHGGSAE